MPEAASFEGNAGRTRSSRRRRSTRTGTSRKRPSASGAGIRALYFSIAALWGYLLGIGLLAAAAGQPVQQGFTLSGRVAGFLLAGAALAVLGGMVSARAYLSARRR